MTAIKGGQRYQCKKCAKRFDDLTGAIFAGRHQSITVWISYLYLLGLNVSNISVHDKNHHKATLVKSARTTVANGEQFPIAVLNDAGMQLVGSATKTVMLSDYDLAKQAISRDGQGFTAADYLFAQDTIEQAQRILRDKEEYTLFIHRGNAIYVAVLQRTKTGKAVF